MPLREAISLVTEAKVHVKRRRARYHCPTSRGCLIVSRYRHRRSVRAPSTAALVPCACDAATDDDDTDAAWHRRWRRMDRAVGIVRIILAIQGDAVLMREVLQRVV